MAVHSNQFSKSLSDPQLLEEQGSSLAKSISVVGGATLASVDPLSSK
jgi:hypothetical protein